jgi:hypothetical protein
MSQPSCFDLVFGMPMLLKIRTMYNGLSMIRYALAFALASSTAFAVESFPTSAGTLQITPIQHASLVIQAGGTEGATAPDGYLSQSPCQ